MIEIVWVRHAEPDWQPGGRAVDAPGLTKLGHEQAAAAAKALRAEAFGGFYVSPLRRARQTAHPIERALGVEARVEAWLEELRIQSLEGAPLDEVERFFARMRSRSLPDWWAGLGDESFRHFHERVTTGLEELLAEDHGARFRPDGGYPIWSVPPEPQRLLIVAHGGSISVSLAHLLGIEGVPWEAERFQLGFTGMCLTRTRPIAGGAVWSLGSFNAQQHLSGLPEPSE